MELGQDGGSSLPVSTAADLLQGVRRGGPSQFSLVGKAAAGTSGAV